MSKYTTREEFLVAAVEALRPLFREAGHEIPKIRVTCGWPSRGALAKRKRAVGQCWDKSQTTDQVAQIFISPLIDDVGGEKGVLEILVHEIVHAIVGCEAGHGKPFSKLAAAVHLVKPWTATTASPELIERFQTVALGPYPHCPIVPTEKDKKPAGSRLIKAECGECGYTVRVTQKWLSIGAPICPDHNLPMIVEVKDED